MKILKTVFKRETNHISAVKYMYKSVYFFDFIYTNILEEWRPLLQTDESSAYYWCVKVDA